MSSSPQNIKSGPIILVATLNAAPGKESEIAKHLKIISKASNSDKEPGCLTYRTVQPANDQLANDRICYLFLVIDRYADQAAVDQHLTSEEFLAFKADLPTILSGDPNLSFYSEFK
ncbi:hypothetical protein SISSUDRAFT_1061914 [Sistotremastrum suecicum HHB10207 ss-3]|uniref:ABM domain-containing protein n=1 Tax=Sistotremastrum suecicum HHB10207 ss-3 TaxID=1314776 RepID=A0A166DIL1_9AGAM|nr:hypothetical protein SISSUDRAFT_1061914 [Sistotremastrum suecicum HHB10207 ss-3]